MPTQQVSSRLIRKERSKLMKQTFWYVVTAVLLVLIFILAVLPNFARIMDFVLNTDSSPVSAGDERQVIQPPILSAPVSATNSAQLKIEGNTLPDTEVTVVFNGEQMGKVAPQSDGTFSYLATLQDGDNTVTAFSTTKAGVESKTGKEYIVFYDRERPLLEITAPIDKTTFSAKEKVVTVVGTTDTDAKIKLNGRFVFPKADGSFSTQYTLADGENILDIVAIDDAGNEMKTTLTLTYRP
ncbi:hypothetical protein KA078_02260 [Candidatus Woesebacteria bacterium]|nr:hypothetical protein [Candidatus Woesebacteria bacterium]